MRRDPNCTLCPLHRTAQFVCLLGKGPEPCDVMLIGEAPGEREDDSGKPFVGRAGKLLDEMLDNVGLSRHKMFITNAVSCRPPDNRTPKAREIDACRKWMQYQIAMVKPKFIGLLGNVAVQSVLGIKGIKKLRGKAIEKDGITYFPMYHPSYILRGDRVDQPVAEQDLRAFKDIIEFGGIPYEREINPVWVDTWEKVEQMLDALTGVVAPDLETTGLYPWADNADIVTIGFGTKVGEFILPTMKNPPVWKNPWTQKEIEHIVELITERLEHCILTFQNGKFDALWMLIHYSVRWEIDFDSLLAHYLHDENSRHDLEYLAMLYFGAYAWDVPLEVKQGRGPQKQLVTYQAQDLFYTRKLYFKLKHLLQQDPDVYRVFRKLLIPAANLYVEMEQEGCYIDTGRMKEVEDYLLAEIKKAEINLKKWGDISWSSPKQVAELLYSKLKIKCPVFTKKGSESTAESALKQIEHPCVESLLKLRGHKQQHSFFIEGWKPFIKNRRIHPSFKLHGTVTGRPSCEHPNFQQVPRDPLIRSLIIAPPGYELLEADLSQIELRIVAELSRIPSMMEAFLTGQDIHWKTALNELERYAGQSELVIKTAKVAKQLKKAPRYSEAIEILREIGPDAAADIDPVWKEMRKRAKAVGFGYIYGMWWKKFKIYARDNYDIHLTDREAQESRIAYFQLYPLEDWHRRQQRYARNNGHVVSFVGRKRRLPHAQDKDDSFERSEALRQAINAPVQSFASDINLMVLLQLRKEFPRHIVKPVITVHDSILIYVRKDWVERVARRIEEIMTGPEMFETFRIKLAVPISGETKVGPWGKGVSLNRWKAAA